MNITMKKSLFFAVIHFSFILFFATHLCIKGYISVNEKIDRPIPFISSISSFFYSLPLFNTYRILTGTNTGYGFFGTSVATQKFVTIEILDKNCNVIFKDDTFHFQTTVGKSRFDGFPTHISNFIDETGRMKRDKKSNQKLIDLRDKYVEKVFKHLGKRVSKHIANAYSYKISLITVLPISIWNEKKLNKNVVYIEKIYQYNLI